HISKDTNGHTWVMIAADRQSDNGAAYIDFEFLQNQLLVTNNAIAGGVNGFRSDGTNCGRTTNDFILTLSFTHGGTTAGLWLSRWVATNTQPCGFDYIDATSELPTNGVLAAVNTSVISVPYGAFGVTTYPVNCFAEAAVDVTRLIGDFNPCLTVGIKS